MYKPKTVGFLRIFADFYVPMKRGNFTAGREEEPCYKIYVGRARCSVLEIRLRGNGNFIRECPVGKHRPVRFERC